jgi:hypothetical protein
VQISIKHNFHDFIIMERGRRKYGDQKCGTFIVTIFIALKKTEIAFAFFNSENEPLCVRRQNFFLSDFLFSQVFVSQLGVGANPGKHVNPTSYVTGSVCAERHLIYQTKLFPIFAIS